mmetsp:Transcript_98018/g.253476  ORF Transcript_98018/g.253476 Transcript_98018/m.253476 type:complete len:301 (-) Transcript_98018:23-925(-)
MQPRGRNANKSKKNVPRVCWASSRNPRCRADAIPNPTPMTPHPSSSAADFLDVLLGLPLAVADALCLALRRWCVALFSILDGHDPPCQRLEGFIRCIDEDELAGICLGDHAVLDKGLPLDASLPKLLADEDHWQLSLDLPSLHERHELEQLVACAEAARGHDEAHALVAHPELAREEVMVLEAELWGNVRVETVLEGQGDAEADGGALGQVGALVGCLHHARPRAGAHCVPGLALSSPSLRPLRELPGQLRGDIEHWHKEGLLLDALQRRPRARVLGPRSCVGLRAPQGLLVLGTRLRTG